VDSRDDGVTTHELYLKFWQFDLSSQTYVLNTRVDHPHLKSIVSLNFHRGTNNTCPNFMTNKFKIWKLNIDSKDSE
ncbi:4268_t:CDS:1, partial [Diversispora eburnea]